MPIHKNAFQSCNFDKIPIYIPISKNWMENIDLQMSMDIKVWQHLYNFAHEYSG